MASEQQIEKTGTRRRWLIAILVLLLVGGGIGVTRMIKAHKRVNANFTTEFVDPKSGIMHGFAQSYGNPRP